MQICKKLILAIEFSDRGSVAISQAICSTHRVDISQRSGKRFTEPFLEAIRGLYLASNKSDLEQKFELKRFIDEFGTHYASKTILGVKLLAERRYRQELYFIIMNPSVFQN